MSRRKRPPSSEIRWVHRPERQIEDTSISEELWPYSLVFSPGVNAFGGARWYTVAISKNFQEAVELLRVYRTNSCRPGGWWKMEIYERRWQEQRTQTQLGQARL